MDNKQFAADRLSKRDALIATVLGVVFAGIYLVFAPRGMEPALWGDLCVASGLRPPSSLFPGVWRIVTSGLLSLVGIGYISAFLRLAGCVLGGVCVALVYLVVRQIVAFLSRARDIGMWTPIATLITLLATICFGAGDAMWRIVAPMAPGAIHLVLQLLAVQLFLRWLLKGGHWRMVLSMLLAGFVTAESVMGFAFPLVVYIAYRLYVDAWIAARGTADTEIPAWLVLPRWKMFFSFMIGLLALVGVNVWAFVHFGGQDAAQWDAFSVAVHYAIGYYQSLLSAASPIGWILALTFSVLPFIAALVTFPMLCRETEPIRFRPGLILLFAGVLALLQGGILPYTRLWSFSSGGLEVHSDFLECLFSFCTVATIALSCSCFMLGCQHRYAYDSDDGMFTPVEPRGYFMRNLVPFVVCLCMIPVVVRIYRPVETELRAIVRDAIVETVRECGDAKFVFTDGKLDAGLELIANQMGSGLKPLNMMSGASNWEKHIRTRHFEEGSADRDLAETGTAVLLRVWAGERDNGMDEAAAQLGFEFWRRARKPLPPQSGMVARTKGIDDAETSRGIKAATAIARRIIYIAKNHPHMAISEELRDAVSAVSWRISRFARMRDDETLANELDEWNDAVKHLMRLVDYERMRTFMQLTPYEGLRLALRRADFNEARRYAQTVLQIDPEDAEANFGTGMAFLMEEKFKDAEFYLERTLKARPDEPAVLNNLSIIYRKTNRLDKSLELVKKAHELMPANEEIKRTLKDTERAIQNREKTLRSAFDR